MAENDSVLLDVKDLKVIYKTDHGTVNAVNNISFTVGKGTTLGLVGETGAGKTTTALSLMGLLPERVGQIENGSIKFKGTELTELSEAQMRKLRGRNISMIFQDPMTSLNPVLRVEHQIREPLEIHGYEDVHAEVDKYLSLVGIPVERKYEFPHQFSGGMRQRVMIAIALACEPDLVIADEPTTALDVTIQAQVLQVIHGLKERLDTSMLLITHDLGVVAQTCDYVAIMYAGEIVEYGTLRDVFDAKNNHHPYTTGLFGSIPKLVGESRKLTPIHGLMPDPMRLPTGCKFHPRCPLRMDICDKVPPVDVCVGAHRIKCHLWKDSDG